jgi:RNA polymerase sigma-70 factor (ECF subfamily)
MKVENSDSGKTGELINQCRKGDRKAQSEIYRLYYKAMYNTCLRLVSFPAEAEDIMQEAFLSAFRKIDTYKGNVSFGAWLKRIVINKSIDALRQRKFRFETLDHVKPDEVPELTSDNDDDMKLPAELMVKQIKEAIQELSDGYRLVITLALIEGFDHEEIAQILSISKSSSRSQLTRARKRLMEILKSRRP